MSWLRSVIGPSGSTDTEWFSMSKTIYYLPGRGGQLTTGLGEGLQSRGFSVTGRETLGPFRSLTLQEQIEIICADLQKYFWSPESRVVTVSYGAYLFLHAQAQMQPYPGSVLLLSPIVGQFANEEIQLGFIPPRAKRLGQLADAGEYPEPVNSQIHVGSEDWQSNPKAVTSFGTKVGIPVTIANGRGHQLGVDYVGPLLDKWLNVQ